MKPRSRTGVFFRLTLLGSVTLFVLTVLSAALRAQGTGSFTAHPTMPSFGAGASWAVALGDLDEDGDLDAVVANSAVDFSGNAETVWVNDGTGRFTPHPTAPSFGAGESDDVALGDLDDDGDLDAVVANDDDLTGPLSLRDTVWLNDGTGRFTPHPTTPFFGSGSSTEVALGDLDGDGDLDAVIANWYQGEAETVWVNDGDGNFTAHPTTPSFGAGQSELVVLGDLDGDDDLDAVVANQAGEAETVWLNDGTGRFTAHPTIPAFGTGDSFGLALGDLDGDGDLDAVVANFGDADTVWVNDGTGRFTAHPTTPTFGAGGSFEVALGDLDGDGDLDAVAANWDTAPGGDAETVWVNDGDGNFTPHPTTPSFGAQISFNLALGDLDGDSDLDVVVANYQEQEQDFRPEAETVWLNVNASNSPPTAVADSYSLNEDQTLTVAAPGVLDNDTDPDAGDTRTAVLVSGPSHAASFALNANGSFSYTPAANYSGADSFSYKARDNAGAESSAVTVSLTVNVVDDSPTITVANNGVCVGDNGGRLNLALADIDSPAGSLTLGASSSNPQLIASITFAGAGAARTATITTSGTGNATITLNVSDGSSSGTTTVGVQAGGNNNDTLTGAEGADILFGQNGNDSLIGSGGNDLLCGGRGNDTMTGGLGADSFSGGQGTDRATDFTPAQGDTIDGTIP